MQLMSETVRLMGVKDLKDPVENLKAGVKYFNKLLDMYRRNIPLALAAYNAGPTAVSRHDGIPPFKETRGFVFKVLKYFDAYNKKKNKRQSFRASSQKP